MRTITNKYKKAVVFTVALLLLFMLSGCESVDKDDATLSIEQATYEYHNETDITTVYCTLAIQNHTIYNMSSFEVDMGVYCNGENVENEPYSYEYRIKHGQSESVNVMFTVQGEVDQVALTTWTPHFESIWKTYVNVIIFVVAAIVLGVAFWIKAEFF